MFNMGPFNPDMIRQLMGGGGGMGMPGMRGPTGPSVGGPSGSVGMPGMAGPSMPVGGMPQPFDLGPSNVIDKFKGGAGMGIPSQPGPINSGPPVGNSGGMKLPQPTMNIGSIPGKSASLGTPPGRSMSQRMSQDRPGFWGAYNKISQGLQPHAMKMLGI